MRSVDERSALTTTLLRAVHKALDPGRRPSLRNLHQPWANLDKAVERMRGQYVSSYKPNPAIFAEES